MRLDPRKKARSDLKSYFVKNAIPTESNFAELIESGLNQRDDGIVKASGDPLSIEASGDDSSQKKAINFYRNFSDPKPSWVLSLQPRSDPADPNTRRTGLSISDGDGNSRLFIDPGSGRVGIGTTMPIQDLDVAGQIVCHGLSLARTNTDRQPLFLAVAGDFNHALYNNNSDVDEEGPWDGAKWNTYLGLDIRVGNDKKSALKIASNGNIVVSGELDVGGRLDVKGGLNVGRAISAGNSDIYFTKTDHNHTAIGNTQGNAAIENAEDHDALMILGRAGTDKGRKVRLWDFLEVNGGLEVTQLIGTPVLRLGNKWRLSAVGDAHGNDGWLRLFDVNNQNYYGGLAAGALWCSAGVLSGSDRRSKKNIRPLSKALEKIVRLRGVDFDWKNAETDRHPHLGLIAQEVEQVVPEVVDVGPNKMKAIEYDGLIALLIEAVKTQQNLIEDLSGQIKAVEGKVASPQGPGGR